MWQVIKSALLFLALGVLNSLSRPLERVFPLQALLHYGLLLALISNTNSSYICAFSQRSHWWFCTSRCVVAWSYCTETMGLENCHAQQNPLTLDKISPGIIVSILHLDTEQQEKTEHSKGGITILWRTWSLLSPVHMTFPSLGSRTSIFHTSEEG